VATVGATSNRQGDWAPRQRTGRSLTTPDAELHLAVDAAPTVYLQRIESR
jgi:hypothetical protein